MSGKLNVMRALAWKMLIAMLACRTKSMHASPDVARLLIERGADLTDWRMQGARELLRRDALSVAEVAERAGDTSEFAFAKAYKRTFGEGPGATHRDVIAHVNHRNRSTRFGLHPARENTDLDR